MAARPKLLRRAQAKLVTITCQRVTHPMPSLNHRGRSTKHVGKSVTTDAHLRFVGLSAHGQFLSALLALFPDATTLYLEGSQLRPEVRSRLESRGVRPATCIPAGEGWPDDWYEAMGIDLNASLVTLLSELADSHGVAALGVLGALFVHERPVAEWRASASTVETLDVVDLGPSSRLHAFSLKLGAEPSRRAGAR